MSPELSSCWFENQRRETALISSWARAHTLRLDGGGGGGQVGEAGHKGAATFLSGLSSVIILRRGIDLFTKMPGSQKVPGWKLCVLGQSDPFCLPSL